MKSKKMAALIPALLTSLLFTGMAEAAEKVTVWAMGEEGNNLPKLAKKYTEQTGVEVEVVAIPWGQAHEKLSTAVVSKSGPDVVQLGNTWVTEFANADALADLSKFNMKNAATDLYFEGSRSTMHYQGKLVSIPWYVDTQVLYYRSDLLAEVGYSAAPKNWNELLDSATKLSKKKEGKYGIDFDISSQFFFLRFGWQNGWDFYDQEGKPNLTDPKLIEAIEYTKKFVDNGATAFNLGLDINQAFADGTFPMFISGPWMVNIFKKSLDSKVKWDVALLPAGKDGSKSLMGGSNLVVMEFSNKKEEAAKFIDWLSVPANQVEWFSIAGTLPARVDAWDAKVFADDPKMKIFKAQLNDTKAAPMNTNFEAMVQNVVRAQELILVGGADIKETMAEAQAESESLIK